MSELPTNCLLNKKKTGCGATEMAIRNDIPLIIAMPTVDLVYNKTFEREDRIEILGIYGGISNDEIKNYLKEHKI